MANYFLKVSKDLFGLGLNPTEILIIAQVMEFQTNTGDCFISDKVLAESFGVSESTITRTLKGLETKGFITRDTKSVKGGKERHISVNLSNVFKQPTPSKMTLDGDNQPSNCLLSTSKMTVVNKQNDLIKDNIKDKEKDNIGVDKTASLRSAVIINSKKSTEALTKSELVEKFRREMGF